MEKINLNVKLEDLDNMSCATCGAKEFAQYFNILHASPLVSPTGKDHTFMIPKGVICANCGGLDTATVVDKKEKLKIIN